MKSVHFFLVCLCTLFLSSCDEDFECSSNNTVSIPQNMKDFFYFKPGSWWVYFNTKTHLYDSLWVDNSSIGSLRGTGPKEGGGNTNKCFEHTYYYIKDKDTTPLAYSISMYNTSDEGEWYNFHWRREDGKEGWDTPFRRNTFEAVKSVYYYNDLQEIDSLQIQNKQYYHVFEIKRLTSTNYWLFAKNVGLIKYIDQDSNQWELINYHINQ